MEAEWRLFPVTKEMGDAQNLCSQETHRALLSIISNQWQLCLSRLLPTTRCIEASLSLSLSRSHSPSPPLYPLLFFSLFLPPPSPPSSLSSPSHSPLLPSLSVSLSLSLCVCLYHSVCVYTNWNPKEESLQPLMISVSDLLSRTELWRVWDFTLPVNCRVSWPQFHEYWQKTLES